MSSTRCAHAPTDAKALRATVSTFPTSACPGPGAKEDRGVVEQVLESGAVRSMLRSAGTVIGRAIARSVFGTGRRR